MTSPTAAALRIEPISAQRLNDYLRLFDAAFGDNPAWAGCYCAYYDDPCADDEWATDAKASDQHRAARAALIRNGKTTGLLAYRDGEAVGWCNAGPRSQYRNLREYARAIADENEPVGSVMCFVIHPRHRRQGIARTLLHAVDDHFRDLGLTVAEGYPRAESAKPAPGMPWSAASYHGTVEMFSAAGYTPQRQIADFVLMRKALC